MTPTPSPIKFAEVTIGKDTYQLKHGALSELTASELGVTVQSFIDQRATPRALADFYKLFSSLVAHHFVSIGQPIPTPQQWAARIDALNDREVGAAIVKDIINGVMVTIFPNFKATNVELRETAPAPPSPVN